MRALNDGLSCAALLVLCSGCSAVRPPILPPGAASACPDEAAIDVLHHDIELSLQLEPPSLAGRGTVRLKLRCPAARVELDAAATVSMVTVDAQNFRPIDKAEQNLRGGQAPGAENRARCCAAVLQAGAAGSLLRMAYALLSVWVTTHRFSGLPVKSDCETTRGIL